MFVAIYGKSWYEQQLNARLARKISTEHSISIQVDNADGSLWIEIDVNSQCNKQLARQINKLDLIYGVDIRRRDDQFESVGDQLFWSELSNLKATTVSVRVVGTKFVSSELLLNAFLDGEIEDLGFLGFTIQDEFLNTLSQIDGMKRLSLAFCRISEPKALKILEGSPFLDELSVSGVKFEIGEMDDLKLNNSIKVVH